MIVLVLGLFFIIIFLECVAYAAINTTTNYKQPTIIIRIASTEYSNWIATTSSGGVIIIIAVFSLGRNDEFKNVNTLYY